MVLVELGVVEQRFQAVLEVSLPASPGSPSAEPDGTQPKDSHRASIGRLAAELREDH